MREPSRTAKAVVAAGLLVSDTALGWLLSKSARSMLVSVTDKMGLTLWRALCLRGGGSFLAGDGCLHWKKE